MDHPVVTEIGKDTLVVSAEDSKGHNSVCGREKTQYLPVAMPMSILGFKETFFPKNSEGIMKRQIETELVLEMLFGKSSAFYEKYYQQGLINDSFSTAYESGKGYAYSEIFAETPDPEKLYAAVMEEIRRALRGSVRSGF